MSKTVNGNTGGIRQTLLEEMALLYEQRMEPGQFVSSSLLETLAALTGRIGREISVYITRDGRIVDVSIGDAGKVSMPDMRLVRNADRLCGVRCIHTHPGGSGLLSAVDIGTLRSMRLDAMAALGVTAAGTPTSFFVGFLGDMAGDTREALLFGPLGVYKLPQSELLLQIRLSDERFRTSASDVAAVQPERAILVGLENTEGYDTLGELAALAQTAGAVVLEQVLQRRREADNATYIGSGKAEELALLGSAMEADLFIFDDELNAAQARNLEAILHVRVIDRTALILDIFAKRAQSREGKLQVELAQLKYELPRILGQGLSLSRQGSGAIARGPGETKLENDRRRIRRRIFELEQALAEIDKQRSLRRERREKNATPLVALAGYTNAGKSTLLNALTEAGVTAEDMLFATLDPVVRQCVLPGGTAVLLADTVGFINKLPHDLVDAFRSTLEEVRNADLILHVIDASCDYCDKQMRVVEDVLVRLGAGDTPRINVWNKADAAGDSRLPPEGENSVRISAKTGAGLDGLLQTMEKMLGCARTEVELLIPYDKYEAAALMKAEGQVLSEAHEADGVRIRARLEKETLWKLKKRLG